jgi:Fuc2NAc and GlcNAc transferase
MLVHLAVTLIAAVAAYAVTALVRRHARRLGTIQTPNERSSHTVPTPSGGGVGIVAGGSIATAAAAWPAPLPYAVVLILALVMAAIGLVDDMRPVPARLRLPAQLVLVALAVWLAVSVDALGVALPPLVVGAMAVVVATYWVNLFNFMDGIDGIAAAQAMFMGLAGALLAVVANPAAGGEPVVWLLIGIAAASFGFLLLNWPPAKIFMGDAGSTYLGFVIAVLALISVGAGWLTLMQWVILAAAFVTDATVTLVRRLLLRERIFEAHRRHAYQVLSRRWGSHRRVTLAFIAINVIWLLPLAYVASLPGWTWPALGLAYVPLIGVALYSGAGAPEETTAGV